MRKQYIQYKDLIDSFSLLQAFVGLLPAGVYRGFDAIENAPTTGSVRFTHTLSGASVISKAGDATSNVAVVKTKQGLVITEDAAVDLVMSANANASDRYDALILSHAWADLQGGSVSTFSIVEGTPGAGYPVVSDSNNSKVIIGYIKVKQGTADAANWTWLRNDPPSLGNFDLRAQANTWTKQQRLKQHGASLSISSYGLTLAQEANIYPLSIDDPTELRYISKLLHPITGADIGVGRIVSFINVGDSDLTINEVGSVSVPTTHKGVYVGVMPIVLKPGGFLVLTEGTTHWHLVSQSDSYSNLYAVAKELVDKNWGSDANFATAVKSVIASNSTVAVNGSGVIQNGATGTHKKIYTVTVGAGIAEVTDFQTAFDIGTRVTLQFVVTDEKAIIRCHASSSVKKFRSPIDFDYVVKTGSVIECLQMADGLWVMVGEPYIEWITPTLSGTGYSPLNISGGALRYAFHPDGIMRFAGAYELTANGSSLSFTIPNGRFKSPAVALIAPGNSIQYNQVYLPPTETNAPNQQNVLVFYQQSNGSWLFRVATSNAAPNVYALFNGVTIPYK